MRYTLIALMGISLGCGQIKPVAMAYNNSLNSKLYVSLGDSITYGYGATDDNSSFVGLLTQYLTQLSNTPYQLHNLGISGGFINTVLVYELPNLPKNAEYITLFIGTNDQVRIGQENQFYSGNFEADMETFRNRYAKVLEYIKDTSPNATVILANVMNRRYAPEAYFDRNKDSNVEMWSRASKAINSVVNSYSDQYKVIDLACSSIFYDANYLTEDGIHPNDNGYKAISEKFKDAIDGKIEAPKSSCYPYL